MHSSFSVGVVFISTSQHGALKSYQGQYLALPTAWIKSQVNVQAAYRAAVSSSQAAGDSQQHLESLFGLVSPVSRCHWIHKES